MTTSEPKVVLEIEMTPEEYVKLKNDALWQSTSGDVGKYLVDNAMGRLRRGC